MHFSTIAGAALFALTASADVISTVTSLLTPCLTSSDANTLATNFGLLVSNYSGKLANQTLASNFQDYSESVNTLIDGGGSAPVALLGATFSNRAQFEALSAQQPSVPFALQNVWFNCDTM